MTPSNPSRRLAWLVPLIALSGCGGQGGADSAAPTPAVVTGRVTVKGKPPANAKLAFNPASMNPNVKGGIVPVQPDGSYRFEGSAGSYSVIVRSPAVDRDPATETNNTPVELKAGENTVAIEL